MIDTIMRAHLHRFWCVEALAKIGQFKPEYLERSRLMFEQVSTWVGDGDGDGDGDGLSSKFSTSATQSLGYANHLGLYSEELGLRGEALGNFPQVSNSHPHPQSPNIMTISITIETIVCFVNRPSHI